MYDAMEEEEEEEARGRAVGFIWQLSRESGPEGCFMTDGVAPTPIALEKLCPCLARAEPPAHAGEEVPLGPLAPPGWSPRVHVWEV